MEPILGFQWDNRDWVDIREDLWHTNDIFEFIVLDIVECHCWTWQWPSIWASNVIMGSTQSFLPKSQTLKRFAWNLIQIYFSLISDHIIMTYPSVMSGNCHQDFRFFSKDFRKLWSKELHKSWYSGSAWGIFFSYSSIFDSSTSEDITWDVSWCIILQSENSTFR